jgi:hypothetical protein
MSHNYKTVSAVIRSETNTRRLRKGLTIRQCTIIPPVCLHFASLPVLPWNSPKWRVGQKPPNPSTTGSAHNLHLWHTKQNCQMTFLLHRFSRRGGSEHGAPAAPRRRMFWAGEVSSNLFPSCGMGSSGVDFWECTRQQPRLSAACWSCFDPQSFRMIFPWVSRRKAPPAPLHANGSAAARAGKTPPAGTCYKSRDHA